MTIIICWETVEHHNCGISVRLLHFTLMDKIHCRFQVRGRSRMKFQAGRFSFWATRLVHEKNTMSSNKKQDLIVFSVDKSRNLKRWGLFCLKSGHAVYNTCILILCVYKTAELASSLKTSTGCAGTIKKYVFNRKLINKIIQ